MRVQSSTGEKAAFIGDMGQAGQDILNNRPGLELEGKKHVTDVNRILSLPEFAPTDHAFDQFKKSNPRYRHEPEWYKVLGKRSLREIAKELLLLKEYFLYYSKGSQVTHSQSYKDQLEFNPNGVAAHPIRSVADVHFAFNLAFCTAIGVFAAVLGYYRSAELPLFWTNTYLNNWRDSFINIPNIKVVSGSRRTS